MMRARVNLITADPDRMADTIGYIKTSVRPAVESMDGSLGLSLYANAKIGVAVLESFWASREALIHSEQLAAPRRTDVVRRAVGTVSVERYRVPVYEREAPLDTAAGLRLTRMDVETAGGQPRRGGRGPGRDGTVGGRRDPGGRGVRPGVQHRAHRRGVTPRSRARFARAGTSPARGSTGAEAG
jgi:hypothetical protein